MKTFNLLILFAFAFLPAMADDEYYTTDVQLGSFTSFSTTQPIDVTKEESSEEFMYSGVMSKLYGYERITHVTFRGYNPGGEIQRHVKLWINDRSDFWERKLVFEGDCVIPSGGTATETIPLLSVDVDMPLKSSPLYLTFYVECTGEAASEPVYFEYEVIKPVVTLTLGSSVSYISGSVYDQDGHPISGAEVSVYRKDREYTASTDAEGHYTVRIEVSGAAYMMKVQAPGYASYHIANPFMSDGYYVNGLPFDSDIVLFNRVEYKANHLATIVLPEAPDPSLGRFYRFDHMERGSHPIIFFEREYSPQANVPYAIFPYHDFNINVADYDLANLPEPEFATAFPEEEHNVYGFYGTYNSTDMDYTSFILDDTPDCVADGMTIRRAGAFRCYFYGFGKRDISFNSDYIPLVELGKQWHVLRSVIGSNPHFVQFTLMNEEVVKDGKTYWKMYRSEDDATVVYDAGLLREEDRKVYIYDTDLQEEYLMFDYSLKEGDTYQTYSYDEQKMVTYKVMSVSDYTEGPEVICNYYDETADSLTTHHRYLRKWTVCRADNELLQKTWIEGVGSLEGPFGNLYDQCPNSISSYLTYVLYNDQQDYLPFSFYDDFNEGIVWTHGCNLPKGETDHSEDWHHQLNYELEGNRLHVYGKALTNCGPHSYAYFIEKPTDDPLVHKIEFVIQDVEPTTTCMALRATDFYVTGFDPALNYIIVDNQGEEHPVVNKAQQIAYRPMVEDGKVWKVGGVGSNPVQLVEYYFFDGDTIINGKTCKQMMRQRFVNPEHPDYDDVSQYPALSYAGAWYEEDQRVYAYDSIANQFKLMYDFSLADNGTFLMDGLAYVLGLRQTGGLTGFKGVYRDVRLWADGDRIYSPTWLEGVGSIDGPTINVYPGYVDPAWFLMSCTLDDEVVYLNDEMEDGATPEGSQARNRFDFTHTIKTQPKVPMKREAEKMLYGEYGEQLLSINLDPLGDTYRVRITDEMGKAVYEKTVNASNIVGLSINISAYPKGRYTVVVENSQESFVGEFETRTTGIEEIDLAPALVRGEKAIFNLQGQRIGSLQKGLNIVNGQKVYVK